jgi:AraC-like DNA-binding protein
VGVWTRLWERRLDGRGAVRGFKLRPGAAAALVDDASAFSDQVTALDAVVPAPPRAATFDPAASADEVVFEALSAWLARVRRHHADTPTAVQAVAVARADPALGRVDQLCAAVGLSERSLQRLFRLHVGASPKQILRRLRLQEAAVRMERGDHVSLTDLAFSLGYADQAHFTRDWRAAVAVAPSGFVRRRG